MRHDQKNTVSATLRKAIERSSMTRYAIAKATGVTESSLGRFVSGKHMLSLEAVDKVAKLLGLRMVSR